ncbi:MAG: hypothetical protein HZY74_00060 [Brevundimonas sp.]|nr:MAG: hypothetical protein HZY74_00060 [Brevundimonas sp.]
MREAGAVELKLRQPTPAEWRNGGAVSAVVLAHMLGVYLVSQARPLPPEYVQPVINVELVRPELPPPPPPRRRLNPGSESWGGRAAAASVVHRTPPPPPRSSERSGPRRFRLLSRT